MKLLTITANPAIDFMIAVDNWHYGEINQGKHNAMYAGGKGINVATALAQLEVKNPIVTGWLGKNNADIFRRHFAKNKLIDKFICVDGDTRINVKINNSDDNQTTDINFSGINIDKTALDKFQQQLSSLLTEKTLCVLSGSLAQGLSTDFYSKTITDLRNNRHFVILDASGKALQEVIKTQTFPQIIKPNIHELNAVSERKLTSEQHIIEYTKSWFSQGLELLVVSLGEDGALFITKEQTIKAIPPQVTITSTVGAGDAMVAGISYAILQQLPLEKMAKFATALSVAKITPLEKDLTLSARIEQFLAQIIIN
ncbi:MAG: 1-phosphofructokinase [Moraxellaceae bacterium]|nr:1-phosphofructokinase [Moraxellaceae bacterium]